MVVPFGVQSDEYRARASTGADARRAISLGVLHGEASVEPRERDALRLGEREVVAVATPARRVTLRRELPHAGVLVVLDRRLIIDRRRALNDGEPPPRLRHGEPVPSVGLVEKRHAWV